MSTKDVFYLALFGLIVYLILKVRGQAISQQAQLTDIAQKPTTLTTVINQPAPTTTPPPPFDYKTAFDNYEPNPTGVITT
ncbi:hypothetical protein [Spirosoma pomorum]